MPSALSRRAFLHAAAAAPFAGAQILRRPDANPVTQGPLKPMQIGRAVRWSMLPSGGSWKERLQAAAAAGFEGIEMTAVESPVEADEIARAAADARLTIHSVVCPATADL